MAVRPDTTTGTITLTSGLVAFTTSGTNMQTRGHQPGDTIHRNGLTLIIATITGENTGTLEDTCPAGAAGVGVPVRIRFQADGSRVAAQTRNLIDLLGGGQLASLAGLDGAGGNKGLMLSGSETAETFPLTAFARTLLDDADGLSALTTLGVSAFAKSLLDDANASAALTTLGVSAFAKSLLDDANASAALTTLGTLPVQSNTQDSTEDRLMRTGAFGIGLTGSPSIITNFNTVSAEASGFYGFLSGASNRPPDDFSGVLQVINLSSTARVQIAASATIDGVIWTRRYSGGAWGTWKPVTPQIITSATDLAWRFANGLQICLRTTALTAACETSAAGTFNGTASWSFLAPFLSGSVVNAISIANSTSRWGGNATGVTTTGCTLRHFAGASSATETNIYGIAIGRWE